MRTLMRKREICMHVVIQFNVDTTKTFYIKPVFNKSMSVFMFSLVEYNINLEWPSSLELDLCITDVSCINQRKLAPRGNYCILPSSGHF